MHVIWSIVTTLIIIVLMNNIRFRFDERWNRRLFACATFLVILTNALLLNTQILALALFVFVIVSSFSFHWRGALLSSFLSIICIEIFAPVSHWQQLAFLLPGYIAVGLVSLQYARFLQHETTRNQISRDQLFRQAKELNIMRNIGTALQGTLDLDAILHIILTAITAGHGHGYNRALLFLLTEDGLKLHGRAAIGSLRSEEGIQIWKITTRERMDFEDYIEHKQQAATANHALIAAIQTISIDLHSDHPLTRSLRMREPLITNLKDDAILNSANLRDIGEVAIIPLLNKGEMLGVIVVDNHVNRVRINVDDVDRLQPLADQAALAIHNAKLYHQTQELAIRDGLTGLHNQRFFEEMLQTIYNSNRHRQIPLSMLVIDIDYFKNYNDQNGHLAGNELLIRLADILKKSVRKEDLTFRFGGEEFVILLSSLQKNDAMRVAEKIRKIIEDTAFDFEERQPNGQLTVSIGVASFPDDKDRPRELFEAADAALYAAKRTGRNRVVCYEEAMTWSI